MINPKSQKEKVIIYLQKKYNKLSIYDIPLFYNKEKGLYVRLSDKNYIVRSTPSDNKEFKKVPNIYLDLSEA